MIEVSYRSWDFYTTGQQVDGLQQKKKTGFNLTEMEHWTNTDARKKEYRYYE